MMGAARASVPAISIVMATFNRPDALHRCLHTLLAQRCPYDFEIIVVDNAPVPGAMAALADTFPTVRWLHEPIAGLSRARNLGIDAARGEVIVTTDDDIIAPADWLARLTAPLFAGDPTLAATTGNCLPLKVDTPAEALFEAYGGLRHGEQAATFDARWMAQWRIAFPQLWRIGTTANAAFRISVLRLPAVGPFEIGLGVGTRAGAWEDLYCFYRILKAGYRIAYVPEATLLHAHRETMPALIRQLRGYRRGETAFLTLMLLRHGDLRAIGQILLWIPRWRVSLFIGEMLRRMRGKRRYSFRVFWHETLAYAAGPLCYVQETYSARRTLANGAERQPAADRKDLQR